MQEILEVQEKTIIKNPTRESRVGFLFLFQYVLNIEINLQAQISFKTTNRN